ncbi:MAG: cfa 1, partial [Nocardioides sp.]|nr:cfa 1 [Nocardioides sp.]
MTIAPSRPATPTWPGLDSTPTGPRVAFSAAVARRLFHAAVSRLDVSVVVVTDDNGSTQTFGRGGPVMTIHRPAEFYARIGRHQLIGFGEAYLTGAWEAEDLSGFLTVLAGDLPDLVPQGLQKLRAAVVRRPPRAQRGTEKNTRTNIAHHYDLSNELFELFLDPTLSYSSALFPTEIVDRGDHLEAPAPY